METAHFAKWSKKYEDLCVCGAMEQNFNPPNVRVRVRA
jgi:hypothetical protein